MADPVVLASVRDSQFKGVARRHVLVTNDFPPKVGGIQNYLYEIYRRLPPGDVCVITRSHGQDRSFDQSADFEIIRLKAKVLLPTPKLKATVAELLKDMSAESVALDPLLLLGSLAHSLIIPPTLVVHGAEAVIPSAIPLLRRWVRGVLGSSAGIVSAGEYTLAALEKLGNAKSNALSFVCVIPPGVDTMRFSPLDELPRNQLRTDLGITTGDFVVAGFSRLVPRKGMDTLIRACAIAQGEVPNLRLVIGGDGRDRGRLEKLAKNQGVEVDFLGKLTQSQVLNMYRSADLFGMLCRNRWFGLEQEGFGIVFLEAAACGVPQIAGDSGGAREAVADGGSGYVISRPKDVAAVAARIVELALDPGLRAKMGAFSRRRVIESFDYSTLAKAYGDYFGL